MKILTAFFLLGLSVSAYPQNTGARSDALGGAYLGLSDLFSAANNQALLPKIRKVQAGIFFQNRFLLKNLNTGAFAVALPLGKGTSALYYRNYGYSLYRENQIGLAYALPFGPDFSMGIAINFRSLQLGEGLGSETAFYPDIGLNYQISKLFSLGFQLKNITLAEKAAQLNERWPVVGSFGFNYMPNPKLLLLAQGNVFASRPFELNAGGEYSVSDLFSLRMGFTTNPSRASLGFGIKIRSFQIDLTSSYQAMLGFVPSLNIIFINEK